MKPSPCDVLVTGGSSPRRGVIATFLCLVTLFTVFLVPDTEAARKRHRPTVHRGHPVTRDLSSFPSLRRLRAPAESVLLKDLSTGQVLYEVDPARRVPPASLTKIMTALVVLDYGHLDESVTVSREASLARKIHLRLRAGQVFRLEDLLKAMLITSANDACLALAIHVGGSEAQFVELMNRKAQALGLADTHYENACGFDSPLHYTTAHDLASLTEMALQHPLFRSYVKEERDIMSAQNSRHSYSLRTTNRLLGRMPGVEGVKTGFTSKAGRCLVAKVSQNGRELLLVLLHAPRRWNTATYLINYGLHTSPGSATPPVSLRTSVSYR